MPHTKANAILSQLPSEEFKFLLPHLKMVSLKKGEVLFEPGGTIDRYYFPLTCALELAVGLADGNVGATTVINMNGIYPLHLIGSASSQNRATVSSPGFCYWVPAWVIHQELRRSQSLLWLLLSEAVKLFELVSLESVCLRHHGLEQITAKLILLSMDNLESSVVSFTQQEMANSLGVRREGVTITLRKFKERQLITTHRGGLRVLDPAGLERSACDCYKTLRDLRHTTSTLTRLVSNG